MWIAKNRHDEQNIKAVRLTNWEVEVMLRS